MSQCLECNQETNLTNHRLITDTCGHSKCRQCIIIQEVNGCAQCDKISENVVQPVNSPTNPLSNNDESDSDSDSRILQIDTDISNGDACNSSDVPKKQANSESSSKSRHAKTARKRKPKSFEHLLTHHINNPEKNVVEEVYECTKCNRKFKSKNQRRYHSYCDEKLEKPLQCEECPKRFITLSHLMYHKQLHSNEECLACKSCDKKFNHANSLKKHMRTHNSKNFRYACDKCSKKFLDRNQLVVHQNRHNNIRPYKCPNCEKSFLLKGNLEKHQITHSGGQKSFACKFCPRKFPRKQALQFHESSHTKDKVNCKECHKMFSNIKTLHRHMQSHTGRTKTYECTLCDISSYRKDNIVRHVRNFHANEKADDIIKITEQLRPAAPASIQAENDVEKDATRNTNAAVEAETTARPQVIQKSLPDDGPTTDPPNEPSNRVNVIQSIGNVKPVRLLYKHNKAKKLDEIQSSPTRESETNSHRSTQQFEFSSGSSFNRNNFQKPFDPIELYRKILMPNNDDDDDNSIPQEPEQQVSYKTSTTIPTSTASQIHWRKRTSQFFLDK